MVMARTSRRPRLALFLGAPVLPILAGLAFFGTAGRAQAAAFCLVGNTITPQCVYETASQCAAAAENPGIGCVPNPNEQQQFFGTGRYCVATEQRIEYCLFSDYQSCNSDAQHRRGICYDRDSIGPNDPFRFDTRPRN
jgi:hypothetical protein